MELFTNTSRERFATIAENFVNNIFEERGNSNIEDLVSAFVNAGFTKTEFFQALDKYLLKNYEWEEEPEVNTETSEQTNKSTPILDYFRFIEMLEGANVNFTKFLADKIIEIKDGYDTINFIFDKKTLKLKEVSF